jgi:hypothetical protein
MKSRRFIIALKLERESVQNLAHATAPGCDVNQAPNGIGRSQGPKFLPSAAFEENYTGCRVRGREFAAGFVQILWGERRGLYPSARM